MDHFLSSYGEAIDALFARTTNDTKLGLERTHALLEMLGSPHRALTAVHIAGTNGKGSVVATAEALLRARGQRVGRYTSPHLVDFRERITIDGVPISEADVLAFLERWIPAAEKLGATFFELTTALAFWWLAEQSVDVAVLETGLGGRLDSTNVVTPKVAVVTSIGLDHTDLLGATLPEIAREKAGIFKRGVPAVIGEPDAAIKALLAASANEAGAEPVVALDVSYSVTGVNVSEQGTRFVLHQGGSSTDVLTPLVGEHQARNTAIAIAAVRALGPGYETRSESISQALAGVFLPGRFQIVDKVIFDVAHNPAGARTVASTIRAIDSPAPVIAVVAVLRDKDWRGIVSALAPAVASFVFTNAPSAPAGRAWDPAEAHSYAQKEGYGSELEPDLDNALARGAQHAGTILITGSFHTVGDAMTRLQVSPFAA